ncbi:MAG: peptide chain release factor 1 [Aquificaceae bacterium]
MKNLKSAVESLLSFKSEEYLMTNLYLRLGVEERLDRKYLRNFKNLVKYQREYLQKRGLKKEALRSLEEDFKSMGEFLAEPENLKGCRGIALFSSFGEKVLRVIKLPYVYRDRLMVDRNALIREIAAIDEELGRIAILLIDRKHVRFFLMDLEGIDEVLDFMEPIATRAHKFHSGGSMLKGAEGTMRFSMPSRVGGPNMVQHSFGEYRFHMRIKEEKHRLFKLASDALMEAFKESKFDKLVIGSDREDIKEIESHLHPYLLERLIGYIDANPSYVEEGELKEKVYDLLLGKSRQEEEELIRELEELQGKGLAANGTSKVLQQLYAGNVRLLLVPESFHKPGYVCEDSHLPMLSPNCPTEERVYEVPDVVDEVIEFALEERARVKTLYLEENQRKIDGLACLMRFSL